MSLNTIRHLHVHVRWRYIYSVQLPRGPQLIDKEHKGQFVGWYSTNYQTWGLLQYIPRNMHTVFALLCFVAVIHWLIFPYPPGLLHWHCGNLTIAPVPAKQPWWIWINTSCEFIMNDCITTTKQSTAKHISVCASMILSCVHTLLW